MLCGALRKTVTQQPLLFRGEPLDWCKCNGKNTDMLPLLPKYILRGKKNTTEVSGTDKGWLLLNDLKCLFLILQPCPLLWTTELPLKFILIICSSSLLWQFITTLKIYPIVCNFLCEKHGLQSNQRAKTTSEIVSTHSFSWRIYNTVTLKQLFKIKQK